MNQKNLLKETHLSLTIKTKFGNREVTATKEGGFRFKLEMRKNV